MRTPTIIFLGLLIAVGSALALMNNACKTGRHSWCAPDTFQGSSRTPRAVLANPEVSAAGGAN